MSESSTADAHQLVSRMSSFSGGFSRIKRSALTVPAKERGTHALLPTTFFASTHHNHRIHFDAFAIPRPYPLSLGLRTRLYESKKRSLKYDETLRTQVNGSGKGQGQCDSPIRCVHSYVEGMALWT